MSIVFFDFDLNESTALSNINLAAFKWDAFPVLWFDDEFEIIRVEVKCSDTKCTWGILGIYRAPK